jgi:hypothetical protein
MTPAALAAAFLLAASQPGFAPEDVMVLKEVSSAQTALMRGDYDRALAALKPTVNGAAFDGLSVQMQYKVMGVVARAYVGLKEWDQAHEWLVNLTANPNATRQDWLLRANSARAVGDVVDARFSIERMVAEQPEPQPVA